MKYTVTYTITVGDDADPSTLLDAAHAAADDLVDQLGAYDLRAEVDEDQTTVAPIDGESDLSKLNRWWFNQLQLEVNKRGAKAVLDALAESVRWTLTPRGELALVAADRNR